MSSMIDAPLVLSRLPVGSSARTIAGRPTRARAIATRCRSPWIVRRVGVHGRAAVIDAFEAQFVVPGFAAVDLA
jgi:hypothetical protein